MDFNNNYFSASAQQYGFPVHQLPPPGPPSLSMGSDDYSNNSPPEATFHDFQTFDPYANQHFPIAKSITPVTPVQQLPKHTQQVNNNPALGGFDPVNYQDQERRESPSDDDEKTPAQTRRKAQNRAAQRAFRERKERHVKELEAKLAALTQNSATVAEENERLKLQLQKTETENQILMATSHHSQRTSSQSPQATGPMSFSPTDFYSEVLIGHDNKTPSHRIVTSESGERLLAAGATWDYIIKHDLFQRGLVDVGDVSDRLKRVVRCDGQGPVFEEREILLAIEQSVASGSDELL
ncbi:bZIP transcription factor [Glarea lozoyensis ATCC 20868]|uniref:BZIP transcription factor n=1 Tax=Glarea lozoyensis (strain ATCC 20868 / MF5171) TaxID=1116229 RepID=S3CZE6_GLAL2|nr:bZIP transcription factor [Glarea lozoyensis ATCC 20868]EPE25206.1 bZIP transcription factor [Glarea lozoyensis ATCC 20868]